MLLILVGLFNGLRGSTLAQNTRDRSELRIGIITSTSGTSEYFGKVIRNGVLLALREFQFPGIELRLIFKDDAGQAGLAASSVNELEAEDVAVIIGPVESHTTASAKHQSTLLKLPLVTPSATAAYLTDSNTEWFFRANTSDRRRAIELVEWMIQDADGNPVFVAHEKSPLTLDSEAKLYGEAAGEDAVATLIGRNYPYASFTFLRDGGGSVIENQLVSTIRESGAKSVAIFARSSDTKSLAFAIRAALPTTRIYLMSPGKDMFGSAPLNQEIYAVTDTIIESTMEPSIVAFRKKYTAQFPNDPDPLDQYATFGYDAARIVLDAVKSVASTQSSAFEDTDNLRAALRAALENTPADRVGLMSDGGFTARHELNFKPFRVAMTDGLWHAVGAPAPQSKHNDLMNEKTFAIFVAVGLFVGLSSLLSFLLWQINRIRQHGVHVSEFVMYVLTALIASVLLFGVLRSTGQVKGQQFGLAVEFGGPAALFAFVLLAGLYYKPDAKHPFSVSVIFHGSAGKGYIIQHSGMVRIYFQDGAKEYPVVNGQALISQISPEYRGNSVHFQISIFGYSRFEHTEGLVLSPNTTQYVPLSVEDTSTLPVSKSSGARKPRRTEINKPPETLDSKLAEE